MIEDTKGLVVLFGAAVILLGAYLIHPGLAVIIVGAYIVWLGRQA